MKISQKRILSLLLSVALLFTALPMTAMAEEDLLMQDSGQPLSLSIGVSSVSESSAEIAFSASMEGTVYYTVYRSDEQPPEEAVLLTKEAVTVKEGSASVVVAELTAQTSYTAYTLLEDTAGNRSTLAAKGFTTEGKAVPASEANSPVAVQPPTIAGPALLTLKAGDPVPYLDDKGMGQTCTDYTVLTAEYLSSNSSTLNSDWYVVDGMFTYDNRITVSGNVYIILTDNAYMIASKGITVTGSDSLILYGQSGGTGKLTATGESYAAGIGRGNGINDNKNNVGGTITVNGGIIIATGGTLAAGIGGGYYNISGDSGIFTINGGTVTATGGASGAGIGGGYFGDGGGKITINGGMVTATGGNSSETGGAGIGSSGMGGAGGTITINGGMVVATGGNGDKGSGAGIGSGGSAGLGGMIIITKGEVTATGGYGGAGIGGGFEGSGGEITISGGEVTAKGGSGNSGSAGIGGGYRGEGGTISISGGSVTGTGACGGAGIGGSANGAGGTIDISGDAKVNAIGGDCVSGSFGRGGGAGIGSGSGVKSNISVGNSPASGSIRITGNADVTAQGGVGASSGLSKVHGGAGIGSGGAASTGVAGSVGIIIINTAKSVKAIGGAGDSGGANPGANIGTGGSQSGAGMPPDFTITIEIQPASDTTVNQGSIAGSLNVAASVSSNGTPAYEWFRSNTNSNTGGVTTGVKTASFTMPADLVVGDHYYYCVVSAIGAVSVSSDVAKVTAVVNPPSITTQPTEQAVSEGENVQFTVVAEGSTPLSYQWKKGGAALSDGGRISGANTSELTITGAQMSDAGSYTCYVSNTAGNVTSNAAELLMNGTSIVNAYINPSEVSFNLDAPADVSTAITWNGATVVMGVKNGTTSLNTSAYSVSGNTLTIKESYLSGLGMKAGDEINLKISFDAGDVTLKVIAVKNHIPSTDASLSDLRVGNTTVTGFAVNKYDYSVELPDGTQPGSEAATVTATAQDANATLEITQATQLPGTAKVKVTAEDTSSSQEYTINFTIQTASNHAPNRKAAVPAETTENVEVNSSYSLDLSTIFEDEDGDDLTYKVSVDNAVVVTAETNYSYTPATAGTTKLVFTANDGKTDSLDAYMVTLTVTEAVDPDIASVNAAKDAIKDGTVKVGIDATQDDKTAAVQSYVNNIISNTANAAGVTAIVTYSSGDQYNVALSKGSVNDNKSLTITIVEAAPITVNSMSVKTSPSKTTYTAGEKLNLAGLVVILHQDASTSEDIAFENFAGSGITVSPANGTVLTTTDTEVTITHTASGESVKENITVNQASSFIRVTGITLNPRSITLYSNTTPSTAILATTIAPSDATDKGVSWQSSNPAVAMVDAAGKVSAVSNGIATITATF